MTHADISDKIQEAVGLVFAEVDNDLGDAEVFYGFLCGIVGAAVNIGINFGQSGETMARLITARMDGMVVTPGTESRTVDEVVAERAKKLSDNRRN